MTIRQTILPYWICLILILPTTGFTQDINVLLKEAESLEAARKESEALAKYQELLKHQPLNFTAICRCSELCTNIGNRQQTKANKLVYLRAARKYAETALRLNPKNSNANFVMAMAMGRTALVVGGKEKVAAVNDIKKYAELAVLYDVNNYKAFHILGKWHYEVSNLSSFERGFAKMMYGGLPAASITEAIKYYEKSCALKPDFALNYLELAKAYSRNKQVDKAIESLKKLQTIPDKTEDDPRVKSEGRQLLKELQ